MATQEKGAISIHTENIFPIIKKFLYSDHEIFLRELVSNAVDATQKLKKLSSLGEFTGELGDLKIEVSFDPKAKTITISDKGVGMTGEEIKKYINQIAFSGATDFLEKFKDKADPKEIIGKFGLGFYSAFMVADEVEIVSLSYQPGEKAVRWTCDGSTEYTLSEAEKSTRGSDVILHINKDSEEFLDEWRLKGILEKYGKFLPIEIKFGSIENQVEDGVDADNKPKYKKVTEDRIINNTRPIWVIPPTELKSEDYLKFYKELYPMSEDPLFWIHLNVDYPFHLTGVLYFPKIKNNLDIQRNRIKLYSRQVFITDETQNIVPDFLMLLHGVIDSPDIPLNVSRSYLQSDGNVKKISQHITKKVADKLTELFKKDRKAFEKQWDDISVFVKYGLISDEKFGEKALEFILLKNVDGQYATLKEYEEKIKPAQTDKDKNLVYLYATDPGQQDAYVQDAKERGYDVLNMSGVLDAHAIAHLEQKLEKSHFRRVDSDTIDKLIDKDEPIASILSKEQEEEIKAIFEKTINDPLAQVSVESLSPSALPVSITIAEWSRRMKDMARTGGGMQFMGSMPDSYAVAVNANHAIIQKILAEKDETLRNQFAKQAYDLALLSQNRLTGASLTQFIKRSVEMIG